MIKQLKTFTVRMIGGANIASILMLLVVGYADRVDPTTHPMVANWPLAFPVVLAINVAFLFFWLTVKRAYALIPVAGLIAAYGPVHRYCPLNPPEEAPEGAIKVMSFNVAAFGRHDGGDKRDPQHPTVWYLAKSGADIICLQEGAAHQPKELLDSLMLPIYPYHHEQPKHEGDMLRIYSKYPILSADTISYTSKTNLSVAYWLSIEGDSVLVVNNHFESNRLDKDDKANFKNLVKGDLNSEQARSESTHLLGKLAQASAKRAPEIDAVMTYIEQHAGGKPVIACGDFNETPISYSQRRFEELLTDCYTATANGPGWSYHKSGMYVRIDHFFASSHFTPYAFKVDRTVSASDHYPVVGWLKRAQ